MSNLYFESENSNPPELNFSRIEEWIGESVLHLNKKIGDLTFVFCSDDYLLEINNKYLKHDYYTDIITFDYSEEEFISGDIFISVDRVEENAKKYNTNSENEFLRIIIHGILHLSGFDDKQDSDKSQMTQKENFYLNLY